MPVNAVRGRIENERDVLPALTEDRHEPFDEHRNRDGGDELGQAAPCFGGKAHLAPTDDLLLHEVFGDVEHRDGDHDIADE